ncbi:RBBP9/YdeN family alpha/beta hydrolase [Curtobacterium sp. 22159]|uniref:RBBP9/YdeN family alpha/beta hydrolase n=1 Tax=Curtobacterium sp. 22159 TaxID=3453882 RepID=UPI003F86B86C
MRRLRPWVIVPGIWNSGPDHWQSLWEAERRAAAPGSVSRIEPRSWDRPDPSDWAAAIGRAVSAHEEPPVLVAHSLGVLAVASWLQDPRNPPVAGAFLVAPPDPAASGFPEAAGGFREPTAADQAQASARRVPSRLIVSDDDPYRTAERAIGFAVAVGAEVVRVGALGHVNVASGIGSWPAGRALLEEFSGRL